MSDSVAELRLPWPPRALHSNSRSHWGAKARATASARAEASLMARQARLPCWPSAVIEVSYFPPSRRGDPQNVPAALKPYIDGIADAMGCDDRGFRVAYPDDFSGTAKGGLVVFRVSDGSQAAAP